MSSKRIPSPLAVQKWMEGRDRQFWRYAGKQQAGLVLLALLAMLVWWLRRHPDWIFIPNWWGN